jgi:iron complex outermembrane recepter protein
MSLTNKQRVARGAALLYSALFLSTATAAYAEVPAAEADAAVDSAAEAIVVTARNRDEDINDVPIPISVVSGETIAQQRVFTIADLTQRAPGLTATTPNARRTGVSLRGIGRTSGNDNMEAAVGVIVDDVFLGHVGMTYQDFTDLQQVEILRGPQGTLLGKNTSLGVIKYTSKLPSFTQEGVIELEGGLSTPSFKARGSYSNSLVDDVLAFRVSFFVDKQQGDIKNVNTSGGHWHERDRWGGRAQLLFKPSDNFSLRLNFDSAETNENSNTKPFMVDPTTLNDGSVRTTTYSSRLARGYFGGYTPIIGSWRTIDMDQAEPLITRNRGGSIIATWDTGPFELKSISAYRTFHFDAKNDSEQTRFAIARGGTLVDTEQFSQEFRISGALTPSIQYQAGLYFFRIETDTTSRNLYGVDAGAFYATNAQYNSLGGTAAGRELLRASLGNIFAFSNQKPVSDSQAAFAQFDWKVTDRASITAGIRYTREQKKSNITRTSFRADGSPLVSTGNATADAIRSAQIGTDFATIIGEPIDDDAIAWLINPSYKLTDDVLLYASASGGGKSGAVAFENNGTRRNVKPEKTTDFELGLKGQFGPLTLNLNAYYTKVRDYQNVTSEVDPSSSTGYSSRLGNIPGVKARGVEFDAALALFDGLSLTLGGAYNKATYSDWSTATCPRSYPTTVPFCDNTGRQVVGAPRWTIITGFNYVGDIGTSGWAVHAFANHSYRSRHNLEQLLSDYGWQKGYNLTDAGIGIIRDHGGAKTELSVVAKNLFDTRYTTSVNDFSNTAPVGYDGIGARRYIGALLRTQF